MGIRVLGPRSFKNRLLILIVALVALAQGVTISLALVYLNRGAREQATSQLTATRAMLDRLLESRAQLLKSSSDVLVADFGFREAVSSGDQGTILSALSNHGQRINADLAVLFDAQGKLLASSHASGAESAVQQLHPPSGGRSAPTFAVVDGKPFQIVFAPVRAPEVIGWVALGFMLDQPLAQQLRSLAGTDVSFITRQIGSSNRYMVSTRAGVATVAAADTHDYLTLSAPLPAQNGAIDLVVQRSLHDALAQFRSVRLALLLIAVAALLGAIIMTIVVGRGAVRPLGALVRAARGIQQGEYQQVLNVGGAEEFTRLADTFMAMQDGIRAREQRIVQQATHDALTGLPNRAGLRERLQTALHEGATLSLALLDIHRFRDINASVGHQRGDLLLQELAGRLRVLAGPQQLVARVGADQFMLALPLRDEDMRRQLETLAAEMQQGLMVEQVVLSIVLRSGLSQWRGTSVPIEDLLRQSEVALVEAKEQESAAVIYQASHDTEHQRRILLVAELREALRSERGLALAYQPLVQITDRGVVAFEALLRWTHPTLGPISPAEFVPLAERAATVNQLSRWVLSTAVTQMGIWRAQGVEVEVAVNLSASDLLDRALPERLFALLRDHGVQASQLMLEVTESAIMREPENAVRVMHQLRAGGVRFAIDDFGTGHSSLAQLHALPVDELKIDRAFVMDLAQAGSNLAIVRATTEMAHQLGLSVVAEGVETPEVWAVLLRLGCDLAQGYYISRPMEAARVPDWLRLQRQEAAVMLDQAALSGSVTALKSGQRQKP